MAVLPIDDLTIEAGTLVLGRRCLLSAPSEAPRRAVGQQQRCSFLGWLGKVMRLYFFLLSLLLFHTLRCVAFPGHLSFGHDLSRLKSGFEV